MELIVIDLTRAHTGTEVGIVENLLLDVTIVVA